MENITRIAARFDRRLASIALIALTIFIVSTPAFAARMRLPDGTIKECAGVGKDADGNFVCRNGGSIETLPPGTVRESVESTPTRVEDNPNKPATTTGTIKPQWGESAARDRAIENGVKQTPPPGAKAPASLSGTKKKNLSDIPCRPGDFAEVDDKHYMCMGGAWVIDKQADASKTNNIQKRNICVHRCTREGGITICRGDGKACDGKRPW
jgi:hypothetical protein